MDTKGSSKKKQYCGMCRGKFVNIELLVNGNKRENNVEEQGQICHFYFVFILSLFVESVHYIGIARGDVLCYMGFLKRRLSYRETLKCLFN